MSATNPWGKAVWRWELTSEAFGRDLPLDDPDADGKRFTFDLRFPGHRYDDVKRMRECKKLNPSFAGARGQRLICRRYRLCDSGNLPISEGSRVVSCSPRRGRDGDGRGARAVTEPRDVPPFAFRRAEPR